MWKKLLLKDYRLCLLHFLLSGKEKSKQNPVAGRWGRWGLTTERQGTSVVRFVLPLRSGWKNCMLFRIHQIVHFKGVNFIPNKLYLSTSTLKGTTDRCSENIANIIQEARFKWEYTIWFPFMNSRIELIVERIKSKWLSGMRQEQAVYREEAWGIFWGDWWICSVYPLIGLRVVWI